MYKVTDIFEALNKGGIVKAGRKTGKTSALLMLALRLGGKHTVFVTISPESTKETYGSLYGLGDVPRFTIRATENDLIGRSYLLIDNIEFLTPGEQQRVFNLKDKFLFFAATASSNYRHPKVQEVA